MEVCLKNQPKKDTNNIESYILDDFNINLWQNGRYVFQKHNLSFCKSASNDAKYYFEFCAMFDLKHLISSSTRITCSCSSIFDHIRVSFPDRGTHQGISNVGLSDKELIYCTKNGKNKKGWS